MKWVGNGNVHQIFGSLYPRFPLLAFTSTVGQLCSPLHRTRTCHVGLILSCDAGHLKDWKVGNVEACTNRGVRRGCFIPSTDFENRWKNMLELTGLFFFEKPPESDLMFLGVFRKFFLEKHFIWESFPLFGCWMNYNHISMKLLMPVLEGFLLLGCWMNYTHTFFFQKLSCQHRPQADSRT